MIMNSCEPQLACIKLLLGLHMVGRGPPLALLEGSKPIPRFVLLQRGLQSNRIAAFKWVHYQLISG